MTLAEQQHGRLEQACPVCGTWEAAGSYCTKCLRRMGPDDWYRNGDEDRRRVAHERAAQIEQTRVKRGPGRPRRTPEPFADAASPAMGLTEPASPPAADVELIAGDATARLQPESESGPVRGQTRLNSSDSGISALLDLRRHDLDGGPCWCSTEAERRERLAPCSGVPRGAHRRREPESRTKSVPSRPAHQHRPQPHEPDGRLPGRIGLTSPLAGSRRRYRGPAVPTPFV